MGIEDAIGLTKHFLGAYTTRAADKACGDIDRADAKALADYFMAVLEALEEQEERET